MATIRISKAGTVRGGQNAHEAMYALVQQEGHQLVAAAISNLTNSSGGTAGTIAAAPTNLTNVADAGTTLAQKAATEAAYNTVKDALLELATKANQAATFLTIPTLTYNGGGTAVDDTIAAITVSTTAATTGVQAASVNSMHTALNNAFYQVNAMVGKLIKATGTPTLTSTLTGSYNSTIAAITIDGGTAASPGVTKVAVDAALATYRTNVKTLGDALAAIVNAGPTSIRVVAR